MRASTIAVLVLAELTLSACADFYTVSRRTTLPREPARSGLAIHLDAQQRLVIYKADGTFCAEASPDAMSAYAAALAFGASAQGYGSGSAANASQSNAASIGLRTQSITLMRDALYRVCEATANNTVSPLSATQLLARSQDLTAVVVAVEQLTGAVAANQAILTGTSNAQASASLISDAKQLETARKNEADKIAERNKAREDRDTQQRVVIAQEGKANTAQKNFDNARAMATPPANLGELESAASTENQILVSERNKLENANVRLAAAESAVSDAAQVRQAIENSNAQALTSASAGTTGEGQFSAIVPRIQLSKEATAEVADAVNNMVVEVLRKDYTIDACMTLMTNPNEFPNLNAQQRELLEATLKQCERLMDAKIQKEISEIQVGSVVYGADTNSDRLQAAMQTVQGFPERLEAWVAQQAPGTSVTGFIYGGEFADLRQQAIIDLRVP